MTKDSPEPILIGTVYYLQRRVPRRFRAVEPSEKIKVSLSTRDRAQARDEARIIWNQYVTKWRGLLGELEPETDRERFRRIAEIATGKGFPYRPASELLAGPLGTLLQHIEAMPLRPTADVAAAYLGGVEYPELLVSELVERSEAINKDKTTQKSERQKHLRRLPLHRAAKRFISLIGDKPVFSITRKEAIRFREWLIDRVEDEDVKMGTTAKDLTNFKAMVSNVAEHEGIESFLAFANLRIRNTDKTTRPPFSMEWITRHLLCPNPLPGLNREAVDVLLIMAGTGGGPSEIIGALPKHFRLSDPVPHIQLRPEGRALKNKARERDLVLVGVALEAARRNAAGFTRYRNKSTSWSNLVGQYFDDHNLVEVEGQTAYSLRHSFEDRMTAAGIDGRLAADLMGHALGRPAYGKGASLEQRLETMQRIGLFAEGA